VRPLPASMARLLHLHKAASDLAANAPDILEHPEVAKAMEQELIRAMITCLTEGEAVSAVRGSKRPFMKRFEEALAPQFPPRWPGCAVGRPSGG
jgi:hypothetical protein